VIPTEPIGSVPRPGWLTQVLANDAIDDEKRAVLYTMAIRDTIKCFEAAGSPVVTDGEQRTHHNSGAYCVDGLSNVAPDGFRLPFVSPTHRWPRLTHGPFRYKRSADVFLKRAQRFTLMPVKQAVIAPSAVSLMYPNSGIAGYSREEFIEDLLREHEQEVRACLAKGAHCVQIDFTEARFAVKIDRSKNLLRSFIDLNNAGLDHFSNAELDRIGIYAGSSVQAGSSLGADVDIAELLPELFELKARRFYLALAGEKDPARTLTLIRDHIKPHQRIFVSVVNPAEPRLETPEEIRDRILEAAQSIPVEQLGVTDDSGFATFDNESSTARDNAFETIRHLVIGAALATEQIWGGKSYGHPPDLLN
jgi:5-methyltetrahydropteroyltriglutamate--homocysteine methyltransferase